MDEKLRFDYELTNKHFMLLAETRFRLLAFVPTVSGAAIALLAGSSRPETALAVGILGLFVTLGITFYDLRNTVLYDATVHRAKELEARLDLARVMEGNEKGGLFNERPARSLKLFGRFLIWHNRGLALIYGAVLGGWAYIIVDAFLTLIGLRTWVISVIVAIVVGAAFFWELQRLSGAGRPQSVKTAGTEKLPAMPARPVAPSVPEVKAAETPKPSASATAVPSPAPAESQAEAEPPSAEAKPRRPRTKKTE